MSSNFFKFFAYILFFVLIFLFIYFIVSNSDRGEIDKCNRIVVGEISNISYGRARGMLFDFYIDGIKITKLYPDLYINELVTKKFPVIYSCKDSTWAYMLISPNDFNEFGLEFPDSLKWVLPILEEK